jgi:hypothetical protein
MMRQNECIDEPDIRPNKHTDPKLSRFGKQLSGARPFRYPSDRCLRLHSPSLALAHHHPSAEVSAEDQRYLIDSFT